MCENLPYGLQAFTTKWYELQKKVIALYDSPASVGVKITVPGIKQIIEKKEGMFRTNIMGKRVNFAARTVISPDPYLATNEIGVCKGKLLYCATIFICTTGSRIFC